MASLIDIIRDWRGGAGQPGASPTPGVPDDGSFQRNEDDRFNRLRNGRTYRPSTGGLPIMPQTANRPATAEEIDKFARANYGYLAAFLDHPEVGPVLRRAAAEGLDENRLYGLLSETKWWQNTSASNRTWQQLLAEDPAEARAQTARVAATIQNRARSLGLSWSSGQIASLAGTAAANGWTDAQIVDNIVNQVNWATLEAGDLTALRDNVKSIASEYLVGVSDQTAQNYAARIASGEMTEAGVRSAMVAQAKQRFSWMAPQLDAGMTVTGYLAPVRDTIAAELEVAPDAINLLDPKWLKMVEVRDEGGQMRAATLNEAMLAARREPQWAETSRAQSTTNGLVNMISDVFGRSGI